MCVLQVDENLSPTDELSDLALNILCEHNSQSTTGIIIGPLKLFFSFLIHFYSFQYTFVFTPLPLPLPLPLALPLPLLLLVTEAREDDIVKQLIQEGMDRANGKAISRAARVQVLHIHTLK